ncbi:hypothetical protein BA768_04005 [Chryseobacterium sp. CBo1]|uniref:AAA family ATPase n=1 Tax=Chryseobacterium sp. CBo1 TaxID=1869230 RepID=UPI000810EF12|nr:AAA family ATPase [Chryseobacterium sp. CBo1]OCK50956.1 hypothetical protein BA768_04005 [Chryseobacterium sp. CBo1]
MKKESIIELIGVKRNEVNTIQECFEANALKEVFSKFYDSLNAVQNYLTKIEEDLENDLVPEFFFQKIQHNIQSINLQPIYVNCIPDDVGYNTYKISQLNQTIPTTQLNIDNLYASYIFFSDLNFIQENTVIVGANGSGKSTLTSSLKTVIDERDGIVIPAQKLLIVPTFDSTPNFNSSSDEYDKYQKNYSEGKTTYNATQTNDVPYQDVLKYGAEYKYVLKTLLAEKGFIRNVYCNKVEKGEPVKKEELKSKLDRASEIWNSLIEHRLLFSDESNNLMIKDLQSEEIYPAFKMSDGEKNILYLIGRILLSPVNALIIIDEPEMYLHKSIVNKLWDSLENERKDCIFVYLTHDLDFASSRKANKFWIKDFSFPNKWDIQTIPENEIPENILMKLLGSRKKILFCEGKMDSLDTKIFEIIFNDFTIAPVQSCSHVINYVRAFNKIQMKNTLAIGIIDRDFRVQDQLTKLETENIFSYSVAEVENLFLLKEFVLKFAEHKKEVIDFDQLEEKVIKMLLRDRELQSSNYLSSFINYNFSESHVKKGNTEAEVNKNLKDFINTINLNRLYTERTVLIDSIISGKKYDEAIKIYNNKGLLGCVEELLGFRSGTYRKKALDFLKDQKDAKEIIKKSFKVEH